MRARPDGPLPAVRPRLEALGLLPVEGLCVRVDPSQRAKTGRALRMPLRHGRSLGLLGPDALPFGPPPYEPSNLSQLLRIPRNTHVLVLPGTGAAHTSG